jgi:hypothetical protein
MDLNKCGRDGCSPVFQTRGEMKPEDHHEQFRRIAAAQDFMDEYGVLLPVKSMHEDAHNVEQIAEHATDVRVSCSKCGKATGWDRRGTEEFEKVADGHYKRRILDRDGNIQATVDRWNGMK